jgi:hypothetical protein
MLSYPQAWLQSAALYSILESVLPHSAACSIIFESFRYHNASTFLTIESLCIVSKAAGACQRMTLNSKELT